MKVKVLTSIVMKRSVSRLLYAYAELLELNQKPYGYRLTKNCIDTKILPLREQLKSTLIGSIAINQMDELIRDIVGDAVSKIINSLISFDKTNTKYKKILL